VNTTLIASGPGADQPFGADALARITLPGAAIQAWVYQPKGDLIEERNQPGAGKCKPGRVGSNKNGSKARECELADD